MRRSLECALLAGLLAAPARALPVEKAPGELLLPVLPEAAAPRSPGLGVLAPALAVLPASAAPSGGDAALLGSLGAAVAEGQNAPAGPAPALDRLFESPSRPAVLPETALPEARELRLAAAAARNERLVTLSESLPSLGPRDLPEVRALLDAAWPRRSPGARRLVLFVCTGNQGRSPMAEHLFRDELARAGEAGVETFSRGLGATPGMWMDLEAEVALDSRGIKAGAHRARPLTFDEAEAADLILTMEDLHARVIELEGGAAGEKTFRLKDYAGLERGDLAEPLMEDPEHSLASYQATADEIREAVARVLRFERATTALARWASGR